MPTFRFAVEVPVTPQRAFELYTSAEHVPDWFPDARAVEDSTAAPDRVGARYTIRFHKRPDAFEEVLEIVPGALQRRVFTQTQGGIGVRGDVTIRFRTVSGGTEVEESVEYTFLPAGFAPLLGLLLNGYSRRAMREELEGFRDFVEREVAAGRGVKSEKRSGLATI